MLTRREFFQTSAAGAVAAAARGEQKRIAIITTIYRYLSHGQHMGDRFLVVRQRGDARLAFAYR